MSLAIEMASSSPSNGSTWDVIEGYVSVEAARRDYGVAIEYLGAEDQLVRLPADYHLDVEVAEFLRGP